MIPIILIIPALVKFERRYIEAMKLIHDELGLTQVFNAHIWAFYMNKQEVYDKLGIDKKINRRMSAKFRYKIRL